MTISLRNGCGKSIEKRGALSFLLRGALRAEALHHVVHALEGETGRQGNHRHADFLQAEGAVAGFAVKMGVQVIHGTGAGIVAYRIFQQMSVFWLILVFG